MKIFQICFPQNRLLACLLLLISLGLQPLRAQRDTEEHVQERLEKEMERLHEIMQIEQEKMAQLHEQMSETHRLAMEGALAEAEKSMRLREAEMQQIEANIQREVTQQMAAVEAELREVEQHMKQAEAQTREYERELKEELLRDGLIPDMDSEMNIENRNEEISVNGKKLSPELNRKYRQLLDAFSEKVEKAFHMPKEY